MRRSNDSEIPAQKTTRRKRCRVTKNERQKSNWEHLAANGWKFFTPCRENFAIGIGLQRGDDEKTRAVFYVSRDLPNKDIHGFLLNYCERHATNFAPNEAKINFNIQVNDADVFKKSQKQILRDLENLHALGRQA